MKRKFKISQSQILLYQHCPYAYKLRYIDKAVPIHFDPTIFEVGRRVHEAIDYYYKNHFSTDRTRDEILAISYGYLRKNWDRSLPPEYLRKSFTALYNFATFESNKNIFGYRQKPLTEVVLHCENMFGVVDYLDLNTKEVLDFKTSSNPSVSKQNKIQATVYKLLIEHNFHFTPKTFTFFYLLPNVQKHVNLSSISNIETEVKNTINSIIESWETNRFEKKPKTKNACKSCEYRMYCGGV